MTNENLNFKIKHPVLFGFVSYFVYSFFVYSFSENILTFLTILVNYFATRLINYFCGAKIYFTENFDQTLIFSMVSILCCFLYVYLIHLVHIYKIKSLKEMVKNTYIIFLMFLILIIKRIIYLVGLHVSFKNGLEILPGLIKLFKTAFVEETLYRGIFCRFIALKYGKNEKGIFLTIFLSSAIFGLSHTLNLLSGIPLNAVINQIIISFAIGCFLAGTYLKSGNIWEPILFHFLNNAHDAIDVYFIDSGITIESAISEMGEFSCSRYLIISTIILLLAYIFYLRKNKIKNLISNVELMKEYELKNIKK